MAEALMEQIRPIIDFIWSIIYIITALAIGAIIFIKGILPTLKETLLYKEGQTEWTDPKEYDKQRIKNQFHKKYQQTKEQRKKETTKTNRKNSTG